MMPGGFMRAAEIVETLPTARLDDEALAAVRMLCEHRLPGLIVADEQGRVVGCLSSVDLLKLALPRYALGEPLLARVFDEAHADRIAELLARKPVRDLLDEAGHRIPVARPEATLVELVEMMTRHGCPLILVEQADEGGSLGVITANRLLEKLAAAISEASP
ncbi:CBS domain-containing protein [Nonomuraea diastatica]|uniref:CBS domain-containing protein n=2 Tax=Nonomuraea diastatica TaxID=1848329 RepID=A0A4R4WY08_9ACTN|nr:CBS domain-containing protein [Nonomuraea diastatica]